MSWIEQRGVLLSMHGKAKFSGYPQQYWGSIMSSKSNKKFYLNSEDTAFEFEGYFESTQAHTRLESRGLESGHCSNKTDDLIESRLCSGFLAEDTSHRRALSSNWGPFEWCFFPVPHGSGTPQRLHGVICNYQNIQP